MKKNTKLAFMAVAVLFVSLVGATKIFAFNESICKDNAALVGNCLRDTEGNFDCIISDIKICSSSQ